MTSKGRHFFYAVMIPLFIIVCMILFHGCTTTREIIQTRIDTLTVTLPQQYDTVQIFNSSGGYEGESIKYIVRVDTVIKRAFITAKPETLFVQHIDTVTVIAAQEPPTFLERTKSTLIIILVIIVTLIIGYIAIKMLKK